MFWAFFHVEHLCIQLMGPQLATHRLGLGCTLPGYTTSRPYQGNVKVIWNSNQVRYWLQFDMCLCYKYFLHRTVVDIICVRKPFNMHPAWVQWLCVARRGSTPLLLYHPSSLLPHYPPTLKSEQKVRSRLCQGYLKIETDEIFNKTIVLPLFVHDLTLE